MIKKIIVSTMFFVTTIAWGYAAYRICAPEQAPIVNVQTMDQIVMVADSSAFVLEGRRIESKNTPMVYYYCDETDTNCQYVNDQILPIIADDLNVTIISEIQYINVNTLDVETSSRRKSEYGFSSYPAFVIYETSNDQFVPVSSLEFDKTAPFTVTQVEGWLTENTKIKFE